MSRYRVEEASAVYTTRNIYGLDGQIIGQIYGAGDPDAERFKHFIEDYDEIVEVLRNAAKIAFDITVGNFDYGDVFKFRNQVDVLLECIDGEETE
jgi:hypothetical protein